MFAAREQTVSAWSQLRSIQWEVFEVRKKGGTVSTEPQVLACKSENARLDITPCARTNFVTDALLVLELIYGLQRHSTLAQFYNSSTTPSTGRIGEARVPRALSYHLFSLPLIASPTRICDGVERSRTRESRRRYVCTSSSPRCFCRPT
jgi:hypothetical protein